MRGPIMVKLRSFWYHPLFKGPDGIVAKEKRVFQVMADGMLYQLEYPKENW